MFRWSVPIWLVAWAILNVGCSHTPCCGPLCLKQVTESEATVTEYDVKTKEICLPPTPWQALKAHFHENNGFDPPGRAHTVQILTKQRLPHTEYQSEYKLVEPCVDAVPEYDE